MTQLHLPISRLLELGFVGRNISAKDKIKSAIKENGGEPVDEAMYQDERVYELTVINGCFYFNPEQVDYVWYLRSQSNHISLNIETEEELKTILKIFNVLKTKQAH